MSAVSVVHYVGATRDSRSVAASVVIDLARAGHQVTLVDISRFTTISQDLPPRWVAGLLGHQVRSARFDEVLLEHGVSHQVVALPSTPSPDFPGDIKNECEQAIESELLTYFRRQSLTPENFAIKSLRSKLTNQAQATHAALSSLFAANPPDMVFIPNGRTSRQKVSRKVAEQVGAEVKFYEMGRAKKDSYYLGTTQPHDRVASQAEVETLTAHLSRTEIESMATRWLNERTTSGSGTNTFSAGWVALEGTQESAEPANASQATFFSSSADEFLAFGPMWNIDSWESQFQAFDAIMSHFEALGTSLVLRLHPNLTGKSRRYFLETVNNVRALVLKHPGLLVHWHNSSINSYELVRQSDYVVTERSTIGLEASLMGKPVWVTQAAQWDLVADIRQLLGSNNLIAENLEPWKVDSLGAQRFVAYWMLQEHPLHFSWRDWSSWNPDSPPRRMRAAVLWVKNPWSHRLHLLALAWYQFRNSRFKD